jgi:hypothetical protein
MSDINPQRDQKVKSGTTRLPPVADYSDIVTDEHMERIKALVPNGEYKDAKVLCGPAW